MLLCLLLYGGEPEKDAEVRKRRAVYEKTYTGGKVCCEMRYLSSQHPPKNIFHASLSRQVKNRGSDKREQMLKGDDS